MADASVMRVLRACTVPDVGSSAACRGPEFHSLLKTRIPWPQGKTQGIYSIQPFLAKIGLENGCEFSSLRVNSLHLQGREFFCQRRELFARAGNGREFRARPIRSPPTHPMTPKWLKVVDKKIINNRVRFRCGRTRLASPDRPRRGARLRRCSRASRGLASSIPLGGDPARSGGVQSACRRMSLATPRREARGLCGAAAGLMR